MVDGLCHDFKFDVIILGPSPMVHPKIRLSTLDMSSRSLHDPLVVRHDLVTTRDAGVAHDSEDHVFVRAVLDR